jgi:hypothetical protein
MSMENESTARLLWRIKATVNLGRVNDARRRFAASLTINLVAIVAAADELAMASRDAMSWAAANPCPEPGLGERVSLMVSTCADVALMAHRTILDPSADAQDGFRRIRDLLAIIDFTSETLDSW